MKTKYQDLRFFNKGGYEIPLAKASNIIVKIYSKDSSEANATILNGVFMNEVNEFDEYILDNFKILDRGCSFSFIEGVYDISKEDLNIDLYIDGELLDPSLYRVEEDIEFDFISFNIVKTTTMSKNDEEYKRYGIDNIKKLSISITKDIKTNLIFPSFVFTANMELEKVSTGLHSTETLFFGLIEGDELVNIEDDTYDLLFLTDVKDDDVQFFTFDDVEEVLQKSHSAYVNLESDRELLDISKEEFFNDAINIQRHIHMPQSVNICCISNEEGYHEQKIYVMLVERNNPSKQYKIGEITVAMDVEGEDERFRALFANFGIPDPINYPTLFKDVDIKEDNTNWSIVNRKSKELFLSYSDIFPYVGTYKALINAVKFLGYDDVYFREWYKDIKNNIFISKRININEEFNDAISNLSYEDILEDRIYRKKLNKLSLMYKLNKESGEYDEVGTPLVINSYDYNVDEVILKLNSLKEWLERHILALNCRIIDITGEGVVYERVPFKIYGTNMQNFIYEDYLNFTPKVKEKNVLLEDGYANIDVTVLNDSSEGYFTFDDFNDKFGECDNNASITYPYINNMYVKAYTSCVNAKINSSSGYLFINDGEILLESNKEEFIFDKAPTIYLEKGNLKLPIEVNKETYQEWWNDNDIIIDRSEVEGYSYSLYNAIENKKYESTDYICLLPIEDENTKPSLKYSTTFTIQNKNNVKFSVLDAPIFIIKDYTICTYNKENNFVKTKLNGEYILEIIDGKITISDSDTKTTFININYDEDIKEQSVKVNYQYEGYKVNDDMNNPYYSIKVNNIGHYDIVVYALNGNGNVFAKGINGGCNVINKLPDIDTILSIKESINDETFYIENSNGVYNGNKITTDSLPIFKPTYIIHNVNFDYSNKECEYPTISYAYDTPKKGDYLQFMNICDKFYCTDNNLFVSLMKNVNKFNIGDLVNIVYYDSKYLNGVSETIGTITSKENNGYSIVTDDYEYLIGKYVYIFPITEYKLRDSVTINEELNQTKVQFEKNIITSNVYSKDELVKLIYIINDNFVIEEDVVYYRDSLTNELYPVYDDNGNTIPYNAQITFAIGKRDGTISSTQTFFGASSFRIKEVSDVDNSLLLDGVFNYKKYIDEYLLYKVDETEEYKPMMILKDDGKYEYLKISNNSANGTIITKLYLTKANQRYVNYIMTCGEDAIEYTDEYGVTKTKVKFDDNRLIDYIDNTYTFIPMSFDKVNAFDYWYDNSNDRATQYLHSSIPVTISKNNDFVIIKHKEYNTIGFNYRWRLYKKNIYNQMRELIFEVENEYLSMKIKEEGIYDVELDVFDKFGNKSHKCFEAFINVK